MARYSYAVVDPALAAAFDIGADYRTLFRSRIKHFQRLGVIGVHPGKGRFFKYSFEQVARLAIALLTADVGLDPAMAVQAIDQFWQRNIRRCVRRAVEPGTRDEENPWFLTLRLEAMRGPWFKQSAVSDIGAFQRWHLRPPLSGEQRAKFLANVPPELHEKALAKRDAPTENIDMWLDHPEGRNFCVLSLSHVLHRLKDHLDRDGGEGP